ncbi:hypothetical protein M569_13854, partial [Genlisea aurea]
VWQFRRLILAELNVDLREELDYLNQITTENPKNYQIWHHRRWVAEKLGAGVAGKELEFTSQIFSHDAKNYHAWSHRQWVLLNLGGWEDELIFCDKLLKEDVFNNSAWNQRYFLITKSPLLGGLDSMRDSEVAYAVEAILSRPENESPWRYLRGIYGNDPECLAGDPRVVSVCSEVLISRRNYVHALNLVLDLLCHRFRPAEDLVDAIDAVSSATGSTTGSDLPRRVCSILQRVDPIRANYWEWRKKNI